MFASSMGSARCTIFYVVVHSNDIICVDHGKAIDRIRN